MTIDQITISVLLLSAMFLFVANFWRYDVVAGVVLMGAVFTGVVPMDHAFDGFSHPAVITVASVLVISHALQSSGIVELFLRYLAYSRGSVSGQIAANAGLTGLLSAFMNNIGALALMLPITLRDAQKARRSASLLLMPLSFASLLGGLITLIGTPPNIIIATFREDQLGEPFSMFDFTPVGLVTALTGFTFIVLIGWRFLPKDTNSEGSGTDSHHQFARYTSELRIPEESNLTNSNVGELVQMCENEISVLAIIRDGRRRLAPSAIESLRVGDTLIVEGESESLQPLFENPGLVEAGAESVDPEWLKSPDVRVIEAVVMPNALVEGSSMRDVRIHQRFGINLLGVAREGHASQARLQHVKFKAGDVLLLQGEKEALKLACKNLGCLAIRNRGFEITPRRGSILTPFTFGLGILAAGMGWLPVQIAFTAVVGVLVISRVVSLLDAYNSIEWPVIVLLGFLIPVGESLQSTGTTDLIAQVLIGISGDIPVWGVLLFLMVVSMLLSDLVHNTPTAVLMAPVALSLSTGLGLHADPFLMAVAVGAASPYLTPIGHQSNTLVMGPGGYHFSHYWRLGLPLDIIIVSVAVPMIVWVWL